MKMLKGAWGIALLLFMGVSAAAQAAQWVNTSGTTTINGAEVTLVGSPSVRSKADILNIPVVAGQSYTLGAQIRSSVTGNWTYVGLNNGGAITERGSNTMTYTSVTPITFTAASNTISVYGSFWQGQTGNGLVKGVTLNGTAVIGGAASSSAAVSSVASSPASSAAASSIASGAYSWVSASGNATASGDLLTLTANTAVSRGEIRNVVVVPGQSYTLTGNVYNSAGGYTYIGVVNGSQNLERGGSWATSTAVTAMTFTAQGSIVTVYGSFWTGQTGKGYAHNVKLNGVALIGGGGTVSSTASSSASSVNVSSSAASSVAAGSPCAGTYILCDDFNGASINTNIWKVGNTNIANQYPVRPANIALTTVNDNGTTITVVDSMAFGDAHPAGIRQGGVLISKNKLGGGRYEVRMKNLPGPYGCSCIWNYYDSENEANPPATRIYTEIDIEMPSHEKTVKPWNTWKRILGLNTWSHTDSDDDATYINHPSTTVDPFDGQFHVYRWDWYDGGNGNLRIDWYVDNILQATTTQHVSDHPAELWVGNWPAPWAGMTYSHNIEHLYIDWVRVSAL